MDMAETTDSSPISNTITSDTTPMKKSIVITPPPF
jgi:hypothetical protein